MLKISEIEKDDWVIYRPYPGAEAEDGKVVAVGESLVHVHYKGDMNPKATEPSQLEWGNASAHKEKKKSGKTWDDLSDEEKVMVLEVAMYETSDQSKEYLDQGVETKTDTRIRYAKALLNHFDISPKRESMYGRYLEKARLLGL